MVLAGGGRQADQPGDIGRGQNVWQYLGGMQVGSIWGHGSYVAPDWTADWLHSEATSVLDARAVLGYAAVMDPGYTTVNDVVTLETNLYDASREPDALVWSGTSQTWTDQSRTGMKIGSGVAAIMYRMRSSRVL